MKAFVELTRFAATADRAAMRDMVTRLEDAGASGVSISDHLFYTGDGVTPGCDPLTTLATVAGLSGRLEVQTVVMNSAWIHPALLLRQFNQLAVLLGGERVTAGLGAGWSTEEFAAVGLELRPSGRGWTGWRRCCGWPGNCTSAARSRWRAGTSSRGTFPSPRSPGARRGCSSGAAPTGSCGWPAGTPTFSTCTGTRGTAGSRGRRWLTPAGVTCGAAP